MEKSVEIFNVRGQRLGTLTDIRSLGSDVFSGRSCGNHIIRSSDGLLVPLHRDNRHAPGKLFPERFFITATVQRAAPPRPHHPVFFDRLFGSTPPLFLWPGKKYLQIQGGGNFCGEKFLMKPILILGIGNLLRTDDGAGVHAVGMLIRSGQLPDHVEAVDAGTCILELPALMRGRERVIIIDAMDAGDTPGTVYHFPAEQLTPSGGLPLSLHGAGIVDALKILRFLGSMPAVECYGITAADVNTPGTALSPAVLRSVESVAALILDSLTYRKSDPGKALAPARGGTALP